MGDHNDTIYDLAADVFSRSLDGISYALVSWGPQGVWPEGAK